MDIEKDEIGELRAQLKRQKELAEAYEALFEYWKAQYRQNIRSDPRNKPMNGARKINKTV